MLLCWVVLKAAFLLVLTIRSESQGYLLQLKKSCTICEQKKMRLPGDYLLPLIQCLLEKQLYARKKHIPVFFLDRTKA